MFFCSRNCTIRGRIITVRILPEFVFGRILKCRPSFASSMKQKNQNLRTVRRTLDYARRKPASCWRRSAKHGTPSRQSSPKHSDKKTQQDASGQISASERKTTCGAPRRGWKMPQPRQTPPQTSMSCGKSQLPIARTRTAQCHTLISDAEAPQMVLPRHRPLKRLVGGWRSNEPNNSSI